MAQCIQGKGKNNRSTKYFHIFTRRDIYKGTWNLVHLSYTKEKWESCLCFVLKQYLRPLILWIKLIMFWSQTRCKFARQPCGRKIDYKSRLCDSRQSKFDKTLNQIPDLNKANYVLFLARARGEWDFSVAKMWPAFYVTLEKQSVETWDLFWDAFRREIASRTHDIKQSIGILLTRSRCSSLFPTFQKKSDERDLCVRIKSQVFFNFAISRGTWKINQARIWTGEYFIGQTSAVLTLSHQTAR